MGAIKDVVDLTRDLANSVEDRRVAGELLEIQRLILGILSDNASMHEQSIEVREENVRLKQQIVALEQDIVTLKSSHQAPAVLQCELGNEEVEILTYLSKVSPVQDGQITNATGQSLSKVKFWLDRLSDLGMVSFTINLNGPSKYYLNKGGREYLVKNNLV